MEKKLSEVLDRMQRTVHITITNQDLQTNVKYFDEQFTTLSKVDLGQAQYKHDALFDMVCTNVRNDIKLLDVCIKELRKNIDEGKKLYGQCTLSYNYLLDFEIKG